jgi:hypothetical protein
MKIIRRWRRSETPVILTDIFEGTSRSGSELHFDIVIRNRTVVTSETGLFVLKVKSDKQTMVAYLYILYHIIRYHLSFDAFDTRKFRIIRM